jgi:hypothetical protein
VIRGSPFPKAAHFHGAPRGLHSANKIRRIIERGTQEELMAARGVYYQMVVRQMESHGDASEMVLR